MHSLAARIKVGTTPDIITVTESRPKTDDGIMDEEKLQLDGYEAFFYSSSSPDGTSRGVAIYTRTGLHATRIDVVTEFEESLWCEVKLERSDVLLLGCIYRSPNCSRRNTAALNTHITEMTLNRHYSHLLITGDFNLPGIDWNTMSSGKDENHPLTAFLETLRDCDLTQHIQEHTHFRPHSKPTTIDLILTNEPEMLNNLRYLPVLGHSHHLLLTFDLLVKAERSKVARTKYFYHRGDYEGMRGALEEIDWDQLLVDKDTESMWESIQHTVTETTNRFIPHKTFKGNCQPRAPWMNEEVKTKLQQKKTTFETYKIEGSDATYKAYARARGQAKRAVKRAVATFEKQIASESKTNPKAFFSYARSKTKVRQSVADLKDDTGQVLSDNTAKASALNNYFTSVFTKEDTENVPTLESVDTEQKLSHIVIQPEDVQKRLLKLNTTKSAGPDGIHPRVMKELSHQLAIPLSILYKASLESGVVPQAWKDAQISAMHKKGSRSDPANYRSISLTPIAVKVLEGIVRDSLVDHLSANNLLTKNQHGFTKGRSTTTNLLAALDDWTRCHDAGGTTHVIYLDFQKAFSSVPHHRLISKLESYGVEGPILRWVQAFLSNRRQRVSVNGSASPWSDVISGVPEGSVLGPVLFSIFMNDMPEEVQSKILLFADDAKLYYRIRHLADCHQLQHDLDSLQAWADRWQLRFHPGKCKVLYIGQNHRDFRYTMTQDGTRVELEPSRLEKDLGIWIDDKLRLNAHAEKAANTGSRIIGLIRRTYTHLDEQSMSMLYKSLCRPSVEYAHSAWYPHYGKDEKVLENVQHRATRFIPSLRDYDYEERLRRLKLPSLAYRRDRGDMVEIYKHMNGMYDTDASYLKRADARTRGHGKHLSKEDAQTRPRRRFFGYRVVDTWNALPRETVNSNTLNQFKNRLDSFWSNSKYSQEPPRKRYDKSERY